MKFAMLCETPYQLFNVLNFVYSELNDNDSVDLYINLVKNGMCSYYERAKNVTRFNQVSSFTSPQRENGLLIYKYRRFLEYFFPEASLNYSLNHKLVKNRSYYDVIVLAFPNPLIVNFCKFYSKADIWFIEDGTGSYHGKIGNAIGSKISKLLEPLLHKGSEYVLPSKLFVYKPEICKSEYDNLEICRLKTISNSSNKYTNIEMVFGVPDDDSDMCFYLSQPINNESYTKKERTLFSSLCEHISDICVRVHPADSLNNYTRYKGVSIDSGKFQWEVKCSKCINENSVLIGTCSTAQITPKLIYDIEPYLIFTYKIYSDVLPNELLDKWNQLIVDVRNMYKEKCKVITPNTIEELIESLMLIGK